MHHMRRGSLPEGLGRGAARRSDRGRGGLGVPPIRILAAVRGPPWGGLPRAECPWCVASRFTSAGAVDNTSRYSNLAAGRRPLRHRPHGPSRVPDREVWLDRALQAAEVTQDGSLVESLVYTLGGTTREHISLLGLAEQLAASQPRVAKALRHVGVR